MMVTRCIKRSCWLSIGIMVLLFVGLISAIVVKTVRKGYVCDTLYNATKTEIMKCKFEVALKTGYETFSDLFEYYDKTVNITGTQKQPQIQPQPSRKKRRLQESQDVSPFQLRSYKGFIDCLSDSNCGVVSKCYYNLDINEKYDSVAKRINGSVFVIKNYVPYHVDYFWDVYGCSAGENIDKIQHVRLAPNSAIHVDSLCYGVHTIRLYVDPNQYVYQEGEEEGEGSGYFTNASSLSQNPRIDELEPIFTTLSSSLECSKTQSCRYLSDVCFGKPDASDRCNNYRMACNYFSDVDESAKNYCLQDCFYLHHSACIPPNATLKSEALVQWVCRGGGIEGSSVDGHINSGPIIVVSVSFCTVVVMLVGTCVSLHSHKRKLMLADMSKNAEYF